MLPFPCLFCLPTINQDSLQKNVVETPKMNNMIEATGLTKRYGNFLAVDNVSFEVKEGEIFGFLGPNGAGKTTTIRLLTGQTRPTSGSLTVAGINVVCQSAEAKEFIGVVPENS